MRVTALNLKSSASLVDVLVMALAAYFALHASNLRINHQPAQKIPAGLTLNDNPALLENLALLENPEFSIS